MRPQDAFTPRPPDVWRLLQSFEEAERVFLEAEAYAAGFDTMLTVAQIRHDIDTRDEFYDAEAGVHRLGLA